MAWLKRGDLTAAEFAGLVEVWRELRDTAAASECECYRHASEGRLWYPLTREASEAGQAGRLNTLQQELMTQLRSVATRLGKSWQGNPDLGWVVVGGFLRAEMAGEDSERRLQPDASER